MDPVPEVLGRSVLVSVSATLIALAIGVPLGTWLALARSRSVEHSGQSRRRGHGKRQRTDR